jgi:hypothetical protein
LKVFLPLALALASCGAVVIDDDDADEPTASYACTGDCSGHDAGYKWAEEKSIEDPDDCGGNSDSFIEGCRAYAEDSVSDYDPPEDEYAPRF